MNKTERAAKIESAAIKIRDLEKKLVKAQRQMTDLKSALGMNALQESGYSLGQVVQPDWIGEPIKITAAYCIEGGDVWIIACTVKARPGSTYDLPLKDLESE